MSSYILVCAPVTPTTRCPEKVDYQGLEDPQIIHLVASLDKDALEVLYGRYSTSVYSLAMYMLRNEALAQEVTQEIFLNIWLKAQYLEAGCPLPDSGGRYGDGGTLQRRNGAKCPPVRPHRRLGETKLHPHSSGSPIYNRKPVDGREAQPVATHQLLAGESSQPLALNPTRSGRSSRGVLLLAKDGSGAVIMVTNMQDHSPRSTYQVYLMRQGGRV